MPEVGHVKDVAGGMLANWPERLTAVPPRIIRRSVKGITAKNFREDTNKWKKRVAYYKNFDGNLAVSGRFRNILDMNANLGGFAAALINDPVWVMNMVPVEAEINTLGIIYERGLIGTYQNWYDIILLINFIFERGVEIHNLHINLRIRKKIITFIMS